MAQVVFGEIGEGRFILTVNALSLEEARAAYDAKLAEVAATMTVVVMKPVECSFPGLDESRNYHAAGEPRAQWFQVRSRGVLSPHG